MQRGVRGAAGPDVQRRVVEDLTLEVVGVWEPRGGVWDQHTALKPATLIGHVQVCVGVCVCVCACLCVQC